MTTRAYRTLTLGVFAVLALSFFLNWSAQMALQAKEKANQIALRKLVTATDKLGRKAWTHFKAMCLPLNLEDHTRSVALIEVKKDGKIHQGTGWFIHSNGYMVTIKHAANHINDNWSWILIQQTVGGVTESLETEAKRAAFVACEDDGIIILKLKEAFPKATPLNISQRDKTSGDRIYGIGYPDGVLRMAGGRYYGFDKKSEYGSSNFVLFELRYAKDDKMEPLGPGSSGTPVLDSYGEVVGVTSSLLRRDLRQVVSMGFTINLPASKAYVNTAPGQPSNGGIEVNYDQIQEALRSIPELNRPH